jgi:hypothetical protein
MQQSKHAVELSALLVDEIYGELTSVCMSSSADIFCDRVMAFARLHDLLIKSDRCIADIYDSITKRSITIATTQSSNST